jgi:hypothetical protein
VKVGDTVWTNYRRKREPVKLIESKEARNCQSGIMFRTDPVLRGPDKSNPYDEWPPFLDAGWFEEIK